MKTNNINLDKIQGFYKHDYGTKAFCHKYLLHQRGYNLRQNLIYIKNPDFKKALKMLDLQAQERAIIADESGTKKLKSEVRDRIDFKVRNSSYQGYRFEGNLPVRGQRSKTNARTSKGRNFKFQVF